MPRSFLTTAIVLLALASVSTGCRSVDPYCQNAIANLRAEKIQLENEYYALKSRYESDMARLGEPVTDWSTPVTPTIMDGEIIYQDSYPENIDGFEGTALPSNATMAGHIRSIEINQLSTGSNEMARLLVRPLDDQGAVLPVAGDLKIRLYDPELGSTLFEAQYDAQLVDTWINDRSDQQPGIYISIPQDRRPSLSTRVICDLQYRTADNRLLKGSTELVFAGASAAVRTPVTRTSRNPAPSNPMRNASRPLQPDDIDGQLVIEIGEELNFDSLDEDSSDGGRPGWSPDR